MRTAWLLPHVARKENTCASRTTRTSRYASNAHCEQRLRRRRVDTAGTFDGHHHLRTATHMPRQRERARRRTDPRASPRDRRSTPRTSCRSAASAAAPRAPPDRTERRRARRAIRRPERDATPGRRARGPRRASCDSELCSEAAHTPKPTAAADAATANAAATDANVRRGRSGTTFGRSARAASRIAARRAAGGAGPSTANASDAAASWRPASSASAAVAGAQVLLEPLPLVRRQRIECVGRREGVQVVGHSAPKPYSHAGRVRFATPAARSGRCARSRRRRRAGRPRPGSR